MLPDIGMRITIPRKSADGRTIRRVMTLPFGHYDGEDSLTLKAKDDADQAAEVPTSFTFEPDPDLLETTPEKALMSEEMEV
ncbi:MAG: hypothetical protein HC888_09340 [Candidatus Competibacteraceae bacterium]|nr:hypothetical protein [Candidatus Competibacteraceae bacterium]